MFVFSCILKKFHFSSFHIVRVKLSKTYKIRACDVLSKVHTQFVYSWCCPVTWEIQLRQGTVQILS